MPVLTVRTVGSGYPLHAFLVSSSVLRNVPHSANKQSLPRYSLSCSGFCILFALSFAVVGVNLTLDSCSCFESEHTRETSIALVSSALLCLTHFLLQDENTPAHHLIPLS